MNMNGIVFSECSVEVINPLLGERGLLIPNDDCFITFSATIDNETIAYAVIANKHSNYCLFSYFYVLPIFREIGIGSDFLIYILNFFKMKYPDKKLVINYDTSYNKKRLDGFFLKNGIGRGAYDSTLFECSFSDWHKKIYPIYNHINYDKCVIIKEFHELSLSELENLRNVVIEYKVAEYLKPEIEKGEGRYIRLFVLSKTGTILGWTCASLNNHGKMKIWITYILPMYRKFRLGFYVWSALYIWCCKNGIISQIEHIAFDFDKRNLRLYHFYRRILGNVILKEIDNYIIII